MLMSPPHRVEAGMERCAPLDNTRPMLLFDSSISEELERKLAADRATRWLVRIALGQMAGRADLKDPTEVRLGTLAIHASQLLVAPGWKEKGLEFRRKLSVLLSNARTARAGTVE